MFYGALVIIVIRGALVIVCLCGLAVVVFCAVHPLLTIIRLFHGTPVIVVVSFYRSLVI